MWCGLIAHHRPVIESVRCRGCCMRPEATDPTGLCTPPPVDGRGRCDDAFDCQRSATHELATWPPSLSLGRRPVRNDALEGHRITVHQSHRECAGGKHEKMFGLDQARSPDAHAVWQVRSRVGASMSSNGERAADVPPQPQIVSGSLQIPNRRVCHKVLEIRWNSGNQSQFSQIQYRT